jgi:N-acetylmuramoyl-L-alanine amidase
VLAGSVLGISSLVRAQDDGPARRASAHTQFQRAKTLRAALEAKNERERSLQDYKNLVFEYRHVYLITPHADEVPQALKEVGDLYRRMGEQFEKQYFNSAVETYQFLLREYPTTRYREDALLAIADIERIDLREPTLAGQAYKDFLAKYPRSTHSAEARKALAAVGSSQADDAQAALVQRPAPASPPEVSANTVTTHSALTATPVKDQSDSQNGGAGHIRIWNTATYTRIIIDLGSQAKYQTARLFNPDRIFFDIQDAKLGGQLLRDPVDVPTGGYLKTVRVAQNRADVVRVVLEVSQVKDYSVFELANPDRLVVDVYGPNAQVSKVAPTSEAPIETAPVKPTTTTTVPVTKLVAERAPAPAATAVTRLVAQPATVAPLPLTKTKVASLPTPPAAPAVADKSAADKSPGADKSPIASRSASADKTAKAALSKSASLPLESTKAAAATLGPPSIPELTHAGAHSLTRALGLKTSRIVIDAGHGGHDTGTIGPSGLMEKDLCLDVALRLGKIIQQNFPGAEVIYTRSDDSFVPLEQRTAIANQDKADLFLSIHANSSSDHRVNGVETYYLNFNASPEALQVATRENALAQGSVHDLQDMVTKIAQNEKLEESRDLATDIQDALAKNPGHAGTSERDRGVRKAPFVVLIGANMPSVLAEISFLSNPSEEQRLKKPDNREHIAEGLYRGIQSYLQSTNSLATNTLSTNGLNSGVTATEKKVSDHAPRVVPASDQE